MKLYEEFVARYFQILFDPEEKKKISNQSVHALKTASRGRRAQGRKAEGKRKNNGGEREKEKEREGKRADGRHGSGELQ